MTEKRERLTSWSITFLVCAGIAWASISLKSRIVMFSGLFSGLGAELPLPTRIVIGLSNGLIPYISASLVAAALVVKEFISRDRWLNTQINIGAFVLTEACLHFADFAVSRPMATLLEKIK